MNVSGGGRVGGGGGWGWDLKLGVVGFCQVESLVSPLEECKLHGTKVSFSAGHDYILLTSRSYRSTDSDVSQSDGMEWGMLVRQCKETGCRYCNLTYVIRIPFCS